MLAEDRNVFMSLLSRPRQAPGPEEALSCPVEVGVCVHRLPTQGICPWAFLQGGAAPLRLLTQAPTLEIWKFCGGRAGEGLPNPERIWGGTKLRDPPLFLLGSPNPPTPHQWRQAEGSTWADLT